MKHTLHVNAQWKQKWKLFRLITSPSPLPLHKNQHLSLAFIGVAIQIRATPCTIARILAIEKLSSIIHFWRDFSRPKLFVRPHLRSTAALPLFHIYGEHGQRTDYKTTFLCVSVCEATPKTMARMWGYTALMWLRPRTDGLCKQKEKIYSFRSTFSSWLNCFRWYLAGILWNRTWKWAWSPLPISFGTRKVLPTSNKPEYGQTWLPFLALRPHVFLRRSVVPYIPIETLCSSTPMQGSSFAFSVSGI